MTKTISLIVAGIAATALTVGPALAGKVTAWDGRKEITVDGKKYEISGSRTKVTIGGKAGDRGAIKAGMDCTVKGAAGGEASEISCK
jgi:hypothetical protein